MVIHRIRQSGHRPVWLVLLAVTLLAITSAAASAGSPSASRGLESAAKTVVSASIDADAQTAIQPFLACMKAHGVDLEDKTISSVTVESTGDGAIPKVTTTGDASDPKIETGPGWISVGLGAVAPQAVDPPSAADLQKLKAADEACRQLLPAPSGVPANVVDAGAPTAFADYAACMSTHGIDMPAPSTVTSVGAPSIIDIAPGSSPDIGQPTGAVKTVIGGYAVSGGADLSNGVDTEKLKAADEACRHLLPDGATVNVGSVSAEPGAGATTKP